MSEPNGIHQQPAGIGYDTAEPRNWVIALVLVAFVGSLVAIYYGVDYYYTYIKEKEMYEKILAPTSEILRKVHERENWNLNTWQYLDKNKTVVRIPIDRAIELTMADYQANKVVWPTKPAPVKVPEPAAGAPPATPGTAPSATPGGPTPVPPTATQSGAQPAQSGVNATHK